MEQKQPFWFRLFTIVCGLSGIFCGMLFTIISLLLPPPQIFFIVMGLLTSVGGFVLMIEKIKGDNL